MDWKYTRLQILKHPRRMKNIEENWQIIQSLLRKYSRRWTSMLSRRRLIMRYKYVNKSSETIGEFFHSRSVDIRMNWGEKESEEWRTVHERTASKSLQFPGSDMNASLTSLHNLHRKPFSSSTKYSRMIDLIERGLLDDSFPAVSSSEETSIIIGADWFGSDAPLWFGTFPTSWPWLFVEASASPTITICRSTGKGVSAPCLVEVDWRLILDDALPMPPVFVRWRSRLVIGDEDSPDFCRNRMLLRAVGDASALLLLVLLRLELVVGDCSTATDRFASVSWSKSMTNQRWSLPKERTTFWWTEID